MQPRKLLPPTYFYVAIVLSVGLHFLLPGTQVISSPWRYLGIIPVILGCVLNVVADQAFKRHHTTVKPFEKSTFLVTEGVFRFSRNPMYLGFVLILAGITTLLGSVTPWIVVVVFAFFLDRRFIQAEENLLEAEFAEMWFQYKRSVRKWL